MKEVWRAVKFVLFSLSAGIIEKSLSKYLNQYKAAGKRAKDITARLIRLEEQLAVQLRPYL